MTTEIRNLYMQLEGALTCLVLLEEMNADPVVIQQQRNHCREIRAQMNAQCPDSSLAAGEFNITQTI